MLYMRAYGASHVSRDYDVILVK